MQVMARDAEEWGNGGVIFPLRFQKGGHRGGGAFHNNIKGDFMIYQYRIEANLLQLFAHPENSEMVSIIPVILMSTLLLMFFFYKFTLSSSLLLPYCCSSVPGYSPHVAAVNI